MKLDAKQRRELGKKLTQLLETESWVIGFGDKVNGMVEFNALAGAAPPERIETLLNGIKTSGPKLIDQAKDNYS